MTIIIFNVCNSLYNIKYIIILWFERTLCPLHIIYEIQDFCKLYGDCHFVRICLSKEKAQLLIIYLHNIVIWSWICMSIIWQIGLSNYESMILSFFFLVEHMFEYLM